METPETRHVWNGDVALAYQVLGSEGPDLLYLQGFASNVELNWDSPIMSRFLRGLARERRLIVVDPRGQGCSERSSPHEVWPLETMMEDIGVVLDEVGSSRAALFATKEYGFVACMFAATYPERTSCIILQEAAANWMWSEETPWEWTEEDYVKQEAWIRSSWAGGVAAALDRIRIVDPSVAGDPEYVRWFARYWLLSRAPGNTISTARKYMDTDIRGILPLIHAPVLVLARPESHPEDRSLFEESRFLASRIPGARMEELPGPDASLWVGDQTAVHRVIDAFIADVGREQAEMDRVLATILFTDIARSTERAAEFGDAAWKELVERHHATVRALLARYRGSEVDTAGDGFFAAFDGPARAIRCALGIREAVRPLGLEIRAGLHTGEVETINAKVGGIAVAIGARVAALAGPSEVLVSQTVKDLVAGSGLAFEDAGEHELKGVPDRWRLYRVVDG